MHSNTISKWLLVLSCEHASYHIPKAYQHLFVNKQRMLQSHQGYDKGALKLAQALSQTYQATLFAARYSRLLIDLNRSLHHPQVYSEITRKLTGPARMAIAARYYYAYRQNIEACIAQHIQQGQSIIHIAVHSFTPVLHGSVRDADVGLLYDPHSLPEKDMCRSWQRALQRVEGLRVRLNYPYRGNADGLTTYLRKRFTSCHYLGIELEINQACLLKSKSIHNDVCKTLAGVMPH